MPGDGYDPGMPLVVPVWPVIGNSGAGEGGIGLDERERDLKLLRVLAVADAELHSARDRRAVDHDRAGPAGPRRAGPADPLLRSVRQHHHLANAGRRLVGRAAELVGRDEGRDAVVRQGLADQVGVGHLPRVQGQRRGIVGAGDDRERRQMDRGRLVVWRWSGGAGRRPGRAPAAGMGSAAAWKNSANSVFS